MKTLEQERTEAQRQLELATTKSDRNGVLTWVVNEEGATVQKGAHLFKLDNLALDPVSICDRLQEEPVFGHFSQNRED